MIACIEEIAYHQGWIDQAQLGRVIAALPKNEYREYLEMIARE